MPYEYVSVKDIMMEKDLYRALTQLKYRAGREEETSISDLINSMLKEYLHTYVLSKKMGHMVISRDVIKVAMNELTEDEISKAATANAMRYKEGAVLEYGASSLAAYLELMKAFAKANKFDLEISKHLETENYVLIMQLRMGEKFAHFKARTYQLLLGEFAEIENMEVGPTMLYFEFKPKPGQFISHNQDAAGTKYAAK